MSYLFVLHASRLWKFKFSGRFLVSLENLPQSFVGKAHNVGYFLNRLSRLVIGAAIVLINWMSSAGMVRNKKIATG